MEELNAQELELQNQIETFKAQLLLVESSSDGGSESEVEQLKSDLKQLIELTEENLMEVKKQKLLSFLQPTASDAASVEEKGNDDISTVWSKPDEEITKGEKEEEEEGGDSLVGMRCSVPLRESWESEEKYHNAVILCRETATPSDTSTDIATSDPSVSREEECVRVLFSQPLYASMLPCPYFMDGSCRYSEEKCKYSHGCLVPYSKLRPVEEPNYELLRVGGRCLARSSEDNIWYSAVISCIGEECEVFFPSLSRVMLVSMEHIYPLECSSSAESSSDGSSDEGEGLVVEWRPQESCTAFGQWEQHTKGIGSKLLSKMGYVPGQGLGRDSQGRVEPVEIVVLPAGKSLDVCAALREAEKVRKMDSTENTGRRRRRRRNKGNGGRKENGGKDKEKNTDMFDFLNTQIFKRDKKVGVAMADHSASSADSSNSLHVKLFKLDEERKSVKKRRQSLLQALQRHQKRKDKSLENQTREKLTEVENRLEQLQRQEDRLQGTIRTKEQQKKLSIF